MKPKIKEIVTPLIKHEKKIRIGYHEKAFDLMDEDNKIESLLSSFDGQKELEELAKLNNLQIEELIDLINTFDNIKILENRDLMKDLLNEQEKERYRANFTYFEYYTDIYKSSYDMQKKIKDSHVLILGLGGAIQDVATLASLGVGKITGLDFDTVERSNLNRQYIYKEDDIGKLKTEAAKQRIKEINSDIELNIINKKITSSEDILPLLSNVDLVISGIDSPGIISSRWVNFACVNKRVPAIFSGINGNKILINKLSGSGEGCFDCFLMNCLKNDPIFKYQLNTLYGYTFEKKNTAIAPTVSILSGFITVEVMKHLLNLENQMRAGYMYQFDVNGLTMNSDYHWEKSNECPTCGKNSLKEMCDITTLMEIVEGQTNGTREIHKG
ncbi:MULTISPECIES: HesA/MoeB/ThiF family protein [unclassified Lysinibacillus]|uniref:HesA/MoeB/ThiF family protein n=1 Tax=unclassified Lysinibacillus TaxID=2636778 RepID=UPI002175B625|nr:ThiF family adenylyltransferase [Lysinibacillus sp. A4]MCS5504087.1 ThiF family adenylyltransferase [Lysinibacillus sp. A4]